MDMRDCANIVVSPKSECSLIIRLTILPQHDTSSSPGERVEHLRVYAHFRLLSNISNAVSSLVLYSTAAPLLASEVSFSDGSKTNTARPSLSG